MEPYGFYKPSLLLLVLIVLPENIDNISKDASVSGAYQCVRIRHTCAYNSALRVRSLDT